MAENVPPSSTKPATSTDRPGLPYYEKLRRDLRDTLQKKRLLDRNLANIENTIYSQESTYLEETVAGNIVRGFDSYIKTSSSANASAGTISGSAIGGGLGARRKTAINETDRVFSRSSVSYMRDSDSPSSTTSTPNRVATPTGSFTTEKGDKKKKKSTAGATEDDMDTKTEGRPQKRQKISFASGRKGTQDE